MMIIKHGIGSLIQKAVPIPWVQTAEQSVVNGQGMIVGGLDLSNY